MAKKFELRDQADLDNISGQLFTRRKVMHMDTRINLGAEENVPFENESVQFWKVFFDFGYWLLLNPFRFTFNVVTGNYEVQTNYLQKNLIIINDILTGIYFLLKLRTKVISANNPTMYYEISYYACDTVYLTIMFYLFGRKAGEMLEIFQELQQTNKEFSKGPQAHVKTKIIATVLCSFCVGSMFCAILEALLDAKWEPWGAFENFEKDANMVFADVFRLLNLPPDSKPVFLTILSFWSTMFERILNAFSDILFTMTALWFHSLVRNFLALVNDPNTPPEKVIMYYTRVRNLVERASDAMAVVIGSFVVGNLPFYVTNVFDVFSDANIFLRLRYLFYCSYYFPSLFLAAKSCKQMEEMKEWSCRLQNVKHLPYLEATLLLSEVNFQPVALGSFGCLHVNFSLVGSMVSIILTYALLKSQFQSNEKQIMLTSSASPFA